MVTAFSEGVPRGQASSLNRRRRRAQGKQVQDSWGSFTNAGGETPVANDQFRRRTPGKKRSTDSNTESKSPSGNTQRSSSLAATVQHQEAESQNPKEQLSSLVSSAGKATPSILEGQTHGQKSEEAKIAPNVLDSDQTDAIVRRDNEIESLRRELSSTKTEIESKNSRIADLLASLESSKGQTERDTAIFNTKLATIKEQHAKAIAELEAENKTKVDQMIKKFEYIPTSNSIDTESADLVSQLNSRLVHNRHNDRTASMPTAEEYNSLRKDLQRAKEERKHFERVAKRKSTAFKRLQLELDSASVKIDQQSQKIVHLTGLVKSKGKTSTSARQPSFDEIQSFSSAGGSRKRRHSSRPQKRKASRTGLSLHTPDADSDSKK